VNSTGRIPAPVLLQYMTLPSDAGTTPKLREQDHVPITGSQPTQLLVVVNLNVPARDYSSLLIKTVPTNSSRRNSLHLAVERPSPSVTTASGFPANVRSKNVNCIKSPLHFHPSPRGAYIFNLQPLKFAGVSFRSAHCRIQRRLRLNQNHLNFLVRYRICSTPFAQ